MPTSENTVVSAEHWKALVGSEVGLSSWVRIDQALITDFAELTGDMQFIHVDARRAKAESPYGGTIAHGFLTLGLLPAMARDALPEVEGVRARINYGFDRVRFLAPVPSGAQVRARFRLLQVDERRPNELTVKYGVTVEIDDGATPALVAEWLSRILLSDPG